MRQAFALMGVAMIVLIYTWYSLLDVQGDSQPHPHMKKSILKSIVKSPANLEATGTRHRDASAVQQRPSRHQVKPEIDVPVKANKEESDGGSGGILEGVKSLFGKGERQKQLEAMLEELDEKVRANRNSGIRWVDPEFLPALKDGEERPLLDPLLRGERNSQKGFFGLNPSPFFKVNRKKHGLLGWEKEPAPDRVGPKVDYTKHAYEYPPKLMEPPVQLGDYPKLVPFKELMERWPQDDLDNPPTPYQETLIHFDFNNPIEVEAAIKFREARLPFKFINVPEVVDAGELWTDEYLSYHFDDLSPRRKYPPAKGTAQESSNNYFAFFSPGVWPVSKLGTPPTRNNDWTFAKWAEHALYADSAGLDPNQPHFYFQAGVDKEERNRDKSEWTFISRDLPGFSSPTESIFVFHPDQQKGIQCRFGERGVTAATHFDSGRNMIAMMTGAKRYILSPPNQCSKLGIVNERGNPIFRHSMLNFGHFSYMDNPEMPTEEHEWLQRAGGAMALDTVLKAGEVLYIPSHWFHYITSLQKSAQCNVRSGVDVEGDEVFGGKPDVTAFCEPEFKLEKLGH
jgi:hypothetical protein